jgi:hypothetical protein
LSVAAGFPLARISISSDAPPVSIELAGFGDIFVQPLKIGLRRPRFDALALYTFYAPTGRFQPRGGGGVGRGFWTHQFSAGGAAFLTRDRGSRISLLASYDLNLRKRGIDITRGNTFQLQGGAGVGILRMATVGVAGYALWQVSDDRGSDVPLAVRGARSRVFGLGPEIGLTIPAIRLRFNTRYELDLGVRARPQGNILVSSIAFQAWRPEQ